MKYLNWELIKADFVRWMPWSGTFLFYWFVVWNDYISSMLSNRIPEIQEQNPFARNEAMKFVLHKGIIVDFVFGIAVFLSVYVGYQILKNWNKVYAVVICNAFVLYWSFNRLIDAVVPNYLYAFHMHVKDLHTSIFNLFGL